MRKPTRKTLCKVLSFTPEDTENGMFNRDMQDEQDKSDTEWILCILSIPVKDAVLRVSTVSSGVNEMNLRLCGVDGDRIRVE